MSKGNGYCKIPGQTFKVVKTMIPDIDDRYRVYRELPGGHTNLLACFRYKKHADHFASYLGMQ